MSHLVRALSALLFNLLFCFTNSQNAEVEIPSIPCPEYFQYINLGGTLIGKISLPKVEIGVTHVEAHFSQYDAVESRYFGRLSFYSEDNSDGDKSISFRVDFPFIDILPKLTRIAVNGKVICSASAYPPPAISFKMEYNFRAKVHTVGTSSIHKIRSQSQQLSHSYIKNSYKRKDNEAEKFLKNICGQGAAESKFSHKVEGYIIGGEPLKPGEYPWMAAIYKQQTKYICGGSLISAHTILSAAHCFDEPGITANHIAVYLGRYNLSDTMEKNFLQLEINTLVIHPDYKPGTPGFADADVALLQVLEPIEFTPHIRPICLWNESDNPQLLEGTSGIVAGWGVTDFANTLSFVPKKVLQEIVSNFNCLQSSVGWFSVISERTLCAGARDGVGPCGGDSGGGLIFDRNGRWYLRAVVSAGQTKEMHCDLGEYVVYCDIAKHMDWVREYTIF